MTDEAIVKAIMSQLTVAIALRVLANATERFLPESFDPPRRGRIDHLRQRSGLFTAHALRLIAAHRPALERWMASRGKPFEASQEKLR